MYITIPDVNQEMDGSFIFAAMLYVMGRQLDPFSNEWAR